MEKRLMDAPFYYVIKLLLITFPNLRKDVFNKKIIKKTGALFIILILSFSFSCILSQSIDLNDILEVETDVSQDPISCGTDKAMKAFFEEFPKEKMAYDNFNNTNNTALMPVVQECTQNYVIPTVFHVFHNDGENVVPLSQIQSALTNANFDFKGLNPDYDDVNPFFEDIRGTLNVTFALATIDPDGNPTTGVNYYPEITGLGNGANNPQISNYAWDNYKYLNIYILLDLYGNGDYYNTGTTWYPSTSMSDDGMARIVYNYLYLGDNGSSIANSEFQSVFTHELGHWLKLNHTFKNGCNGDGDNVDDTPPTDGASGCDPNTTSCGNIVNRENYMTYGPCYKMFTQGQVDRMTTTLNLHPARQSLWQLSNLIATGTIDYFQEGDIVAEFVASATTITAGEFVNFTDISCGFPTSWSWTINGGTPNTSDEQHPGSIFYTPGVFPVTLVVSNDSGTSGPYTLEITVLPPPPLIAEFTANDTNAIVGTVIFFTDISGGIPNSWTWTINGGNPTTSTEQHPSSTFSTPGAYTVTMTVTSYWGELDTYSIEITILDYDPTPFDCSPSFYQTIYDNSQLVRYDASNVNLGFELITDFGFNVNATAYNPVDNYIYTIRRPINHLIRIHADGSTIDLGPLNLPNVYVGEITTAGEYYVKGGGSIVYLVDINTLNITSIQPNNNFAAADWAYRMQDNKLYGVNGATLYTYDVGTQSVSSFPLNGLPGGVYGAAFITDDGTIYVAHNSSGKIYQIDIENYIATEIVTGPGGLNNNDGASCPFAPDPFIAHIFSKNDTMCISLEGDTYVYPFENDEGYLTGLDSNSFSIITPPAFGQVTFDNITGQLTYVSSGTPQYDFIEYAICGDNVDFPACDTAAVIFLPPKEAELTLTICEGEVYTFGGDEYFLEGTYSEIFTADDGCDSIVILNLIIGLPENNLVEAIICEGESYTFMDEEYEEAGIYTQLGIGSNGCGSTSTLILMVNSPAMNNISAAICEGESYTVGNSVYTQSGFYTDVLTAENSCDSIVNLELTLLLNSINEIDAEICEGESYTVGNSVYTQSGFYTDIMTAENSCDSIVNLELTVVLNSLSGIEATICEGESYTVGNSVYTQSGFYTDVLTAENSCDSIVNLELTLLLNSINEIDAGICEGESYTVGNSVYTQSGFYTDVLTAENSCDSIVNLELTLLLNSINEIEAGICEGESYTVGSSVYTQSGFYTDVLTADNSCDSIVNLELNVYEKDTSIVALTTCIADEVGQQIVTYSNQNGCDSMVVEQTTLLPDNDCFVQAIIEGSIMLCNQLTGTFTTTVTIGTGPFMVEWTGPQDGITIIDSLGEMITILNLPPGAYSITITDANQNVTTLTTTIIESFPPVITADVITYMDYEISCSGENDGSATVNVTGGTPPYLYIWSTGATTSTIDNLTPGQYSVTVIDAFECEEEATVDITEPDPLIMSFEVSELDCFENTTGSVEAIVSGGQPPYSYSINGGESQEWSLFQNLSSGTYSVMVTDGNDCTTTEIIWINTPLQVEIELGDDMTIELGENAELNALVNMPFSSLESIVWYSIDSTECPNCLEQIVTPLVTTTYTLTVTSDNGCADIDNITIFVQPPEIYAPNAFSPNGDGNNDVFILFSGNSKVVNINELKLFDRWGELVYSQFDIAPNDYSVGWDGTLKGEPMNPAVFVWLAHVTLLNGTVHFLKGNVTLIR